jgi:hypothetical protein
MDFWLNPSAKSRTGLDEAIASARAAGFSGRAVFAELSRQGGQWVATGDPQVRRAYRALLDRIARSVDIPRHTRFFAHWDAADIECAFGDPWRAADAARKALVLAPNRQRALLMKALLARAYARGGRLDISRRIAIEVVEGSSGPHNGMALLSAKRTLAHLASIAARPKEEFTQLTDAADLARRMPRSAWRPSSTTCSQSFESELLPFPSFFSRAQPAARSVALADAKRSSFIMRLLRRIHRG